MESFCYLLFAGVRSGTGTYLPRCALFSFLLSRRLHRLGVATGGLRCRGLRLQLLLGLSLLLLLSGNGISRSVVITREWLDLLSGLRLGLRMVQVVRGLLGELLGLSELRMAHTGTRWASRVGAPLALALRPGRHLLDLPLELKVVHVGLVQVFLVHVAEI